MPIKKRYVKDTNYGYYQYGNRKKYYFIKGDLMSRILAEEKAKRQTMAIKASRAFGKTKLELS